MDYLYGMNNPYTALYHHGILGQKWGVRRYQNYDGTYTQKGLARYNKSKEAYEKAKAAHKVAESGGDTHGKTEYYLRTKMQDAKRKMNIDYKRIKDDYNADKGRELYTKGHTINEGHSKAQFATTAALAVSAYSFKKLAEAGAGFYTSRNDMLAHHIVPATAAVGSAALAGIIQYKDADRTKKLRAYYGRR